MYSLPPINKLRKGDVCFVELTTRSYAATTLAQTSWTSLHVARVVRADRQGNVVEFALGAGAARRVDRDVRVFWCRPDLRPAAEKLLSCQPGVGYASKEELAKALQIS